MNAMLSVDAMRSDKYGGSHCHSKIFGSSFQTLSVYVLSFCPNLAQIKLSGTGPTPALATAITQVGSSVPHCPFWHPTGSRTDQRMRLQSLMCECLICKSREHVEQVGLLHKITFFAAAINPKEGFCYFWGGGTNTNAINNNNYNNNRGNAAATYNNNNNNNNFNGGVAANNNGNISNG